MKETLKRLILKRSIIIPACFCLLITGASLLAETQTIWSALSPEQWYWYEPETNFPFERIQAIFKDAETA
jgi:hypothetical protein